MHNSPRRKSAFLPAVEILEDRRLLSIAGAVMGPTVLGPTPVLSSVAALSKTIGAVTDALPAPSTGSVTGLQLSARLNVGRTLGLSANLNLAIGGSSLATVAVPPGGSEGVKGGVEVTLGGSSVAGQIDSGGGAVVIDTGNGSSDPPPGGGTQLPGDGGPSVVITIGVPPSSTPSSNGGGSPGHTAPAVSPGQNGTPLPPAGATTPSLAVALEQEPAGRASPRPSANIREFPAETAALDSGSNGSELSPSPSAIGVGERAFVFTNTLSATRLAALFEIDGSRGTDPVEAAANGGGIEGPTGTEVRPSERTEGVAFAPEPIGSALLADNPGFELARFGADVRQFLNRVADLRENLGQLLGQPEMLPWLVALSAVAIVGAEVLRRRRGERDRALAIVLAEDPAAMPWLMNAAN